MAGFYAEYYDGTNYLPCIFYKWNGTADEQVYQITYFNGTSDVVIGTLPSNTMMVDGYFDWNVSDATSIGDYGWSNSNYYGVLSNKLYCKPGYGTYGVSTSYTTTMTYNRIDILMPAGWTGYTLLYGWGTSNNHYLWINPTSLQLRIGGSWANQVSGTYNNADHVYSLVRTGTGLAVLVDGTQVMTASGTIPTTGSLSISMVPGSTTTTTFIDYIRWYV